MNVISILSRTSKKDSPLTLAENMILFKFLSNRISYYKSSMIVEKLRLKYLNEVNHGTNVKDLADILESIEKAKKIRKQSKVFAIKFNLAWKSIKIKSVNPRLEEGKINSLIGIL